MDSDGYTWKRVEIEKAKNFWDYIQDLIHSLGTRFDFIEAEEDFNELEKIAQGSKSLTIIHEAKPLYEKIQEVARGVDKEYFAKVKEGFDEMRGREYFSKIKSSFNEEEIRYFSLLKDLRTKLSEAYIEFIKIVKIENSTTRSCI